MATAEAMSAEDAVARGYCGAMNRKGHPCTRPAGWGTSHSGIGNCKHHGGSTPNGVKYAGRRGLELEAIKLGFSIEMEPDDLMLNTVYLAAGALAFATQRAAAIEEKDYETDGARIAQARLADAMDRSARVAKMAMDAGISDRRIRLAQRWGESIASVIEDAMRDMAEVFPPDVRTRFAQRIQAGMARLERGEIEAGADA
jgi:hypothetical protein